MQFFSQQELSRVLDNPAYVGTLYRAHRSEFVAALGPVFAGQPEDHYKLAFAAVLSYSLKPYGGTATTTFEGLLAAKTLHCGNYSHLSRFLFDILAPASTADISMIGWTGGQVASHSQLIISTGTKTLLIDPTIALVARLDGGINALMAGVAVPREYQTSFWFRPEVERFSGIVEDALVQGSFRAGHGVYWIEETDYANYYGSSTSLFPMPQAALYNPRLSSPTLSEAKPINSVGDTNGDRFILGRGASDVISGTKAKEIIMGGVADRAPIISARGVLKTPSAFFTANELSTVINDPNSVKSLYASKRAQLLSKLGSNFTNQPEDYIRLAFATVLAYDLKPLGASNATSLSGLLNEAHLDSGGYALLAWLLFKTLGATSTAELSMIGWNGGTAGQHTQLLMDLPGRAAILVDPEIGHIALVSGYNGLAGGEAVEARYQRSFAWRDESAPLRDKVITSLDDGLYRGGHLAFWFINPNDITKFETIPHWASPQGGPLRDGTDASGAIGGISSRDVIRGSGGGDILVGDGILRDAGTWLIQPTREPWYVGDFNGDGKDDVFRYIDGQSGADMFLSTGIGFVRGLSWTSNGHGPERWYVGDFNGDGKDDIFRYIDGVTGARMFLSTGQEFQDAGDWTKFSHGRERWYIGDFNGDGKDDIFRYIEGKSGADMFLSDGTRFVYDGKWTGFSHGPQRWQVGDFNGDGKDDLLRTGPSGVGAEVLLSTGHSFRYDGWWTRQNSGGEWSIQDVNGDGKDDIIGNPRGINGLATIFVSMGDSFKLTNNWTLAPKKNTTVGDFDGNGTDDILTIDGKYRGDVALTTGFADQDEDRFYFTPGTLQGTTIVDFQGAAKVGGDELWFNGFGPRETLQLTNQGDVWTLTNMYGYQETFRILGVTKLANVDYFVV